MSAASSRHGGRRLAGRDRIRFDLASLWRIDGTMIFTDWKFFVFFAVVFAVYWAIRGNLWQKLWLLACSAVFYAAWDWRFLGLVLLVIVNTYATTLLIAGAKVDHYRSAILTAGVTLSLSVLGVFKYYDFFLDNLRQILPLHPRVAALILPIGISFYTFHSLSYMIDTYRRRIEPTRNLFDVALYILFFPQLVAGPIVRATDLLPQMRAPRSFASVDFRYFLALFLIGYFKKAVISDGAAPLVDAFYAHPEAYGSADALIATIFYAVQIYCDFSGYTDMAIAVAGMLGFRLRVNFNHPYLAANITEFWRRWHISLSSWLRDYLYIPLGGNRGGFLFQARNIMVTMLLGGLWHGANWTFVIWGGLHGLGLVMHRICQRLRGFQSGAPMRYSLAGNAMTFAFVWFAWIFFRAPTFTAAATVLGRFAVWGPATLMTAPHFALVMAFLAAAHVLFYRLDLRAATARIDPTIFACGYGAAVALILPFVNVAVQPFIYFQF
jgi:alginate O-acetyltransferase complex protein AlgI